MTQQEILEKLATDIRLRGMSYKTIDRYSAHAKIFMDYFDKPADEMGEKEFRIFLEYLDREKAISPVTFNNYNSALCFLFEVTLEQNLNYKRIPRKKIPVKIANTLSQQEVLDFIEAIDDLRYKTIFSLVYGSGLRSSEVQTLKIQDVDSRRMCLIIHQGKRKKDRYVPLASSSLKLLREYFKTYRPKHPSGYLFLNRYGTDHITGSAIWEALKKYLALAGVKTPASVHTLRHSYAIHLLEKGADPFQIQKLLGHTNVSTTMRYLGTNSTEILKISSPLESLVSND